jgi:hypothetical protein
LGAFSAMTRAITGERVAVCDAAHRAAARTFGDDRAVSRLASVGAFDATA